MESLNGNTFFLIRHGQAQNNVERILVSDPAIGTVQYGLTELGRQQAKEAADKFKTMLRIDGINKLVIVSSDFKRTRETAEILHSELQVERPIRFEIALRERSMGKLDMTNYTKEILHQIWEIDEKDHTQSYNDCETVASILKRTTSLVNQLDKEYSNDTIILVSHAGPLMHLYDSFNVIKITGMTNAEIKKLTK